MCRGYILDVEQVEGSPEALDTAFFSFAPFHRERVESLTHKFLHVLIFIAVLIFNLQLHAGPSVISGTARNAYGAAVSTNILFTPLSTPTIYSANTVFSAQANVTSDISGNFSVNLYPGDYQVQIGSLKRDSFVIGVTNGDTAYRIENIIKTDLTYTYTVPPLYELKSNKGHTNGYASLGADGLVPASQLPVLSSGSQTPWSQTINGNGQVVTNVGSGYVTNLTVSNLNSFTMSSASLMNAGGFGSDAPDGHTTLFASDGAGNIYLNTIHVAPTTNIIADGQIVQIVAVGTTDNGSPLELKWDPIGNEIVWEINNGPSVNQAGNFQGDGTGLTLDGSRISQGIVRTNFLPTALASIAATNGFPLTNLNAANLTGTVVSNRLPSNVVWTNGVAQFIYQVPVFTNGARVGDQNFISFDGTGAIRGNTGHSTDVEMEHSSQGSFSFTGGQNNLHKSQSHFGASLQSHELWYMQYDFVPSSPTNFDATGLWGYTKPFGFHLEYGNGTSTLESVMALRAEVWTNDATPRLVIYDNFGPQSGWGQPAPHGATHSVGYFSTNGLNMSAVTVSNAVNTSRLIATNAQFGNGVYSTSPTSGIITFGTGTGTNIFINQDAQDTLDFYYINGGTPRRVIEYGSRNGGSGTLRYLNNGTISLDWINTVLVDGSGAASLNWNSRILASNWTAAGISASSLAITNGVTNGNLLLVGANGVITNTNSLPSWITVPSPSLPSDVAATDVANTFTKTNQFNTNDVSATSFDFLLFGADPTRTFQGFPFAWSWNAASNMVWINQGDAASPLNFGANILIGQVPAAELTGTVATNRLPANLAPLAANNAQFLTNIQPNAMATANTTPAGTNNVIDLGGAGQASTYHTYLLTNDFCITALVNGPGHKRLEFLDVGATNHYVLIPQAWLKGGDTNLWSAFGTNYGVLVTNKTMLALYVGSYLASPVASNSVASVEVYQ